MIIAYADRIFHNSHLSNFIDKKEHTLGFEGFKSYWKSVQGIDCLFNENIFKQTIALNLNYLNNQLIHNFIMNEAQLFFKNNFLDFEKEIKDLTFKSAIQEGHIDNIQKFLPINLDKKEALQIAIKYNSWVSYDWFLNNIVPIKEQKKTIQWTHKEFWLYHDAGYSSFEFYQNLVNHPLSENKPIKQGIYNSINNKNFHFLNEFLNDEKCLTLLTDLNLEHYYKLLLKQLEACRFESEFTEGKNLLIQSLQKIPFDFSKNLFNLKFSKNNPDLVQLIEKFKLKEKLDLLPEKSTIKKMKI